MIGAIATVVAVIGRQSSDSQFVFRQQNLTLITPVVLEHLVASAHDPRPGTGGHPGVSASCIAQGTGELRNPWSCTVRYPAPPGVRYRVVIDPTAQVHGVNTDGSLTVDGCCVGYRPTS